MRFFFLLACAIARARLGLPDSASSSFAGIDVRGLSRLGLLKRQALFAGLDVRGLSRLGLLQSQASASLPNYVEPARTISSVSNSVWSEITSVARSL